jgi:hypothetical protein
MPDICAFCKRGHFRGTEFTDRRLPQPREKFHSRECMASYMQSWITQKEMPHASTPLGPRGQPAPVFAGAK